MELGLQALLAFTPIALSGVLLVGLGWSAKRAMPLVYFVTALIALTAWGVSSASARGASARPSGRSRWCGSLR